MLKKSVADIAILVTEIIISCLLRIFRTFVIINSFKNLLVWKRKEVVIFNWKCQKKNKFSTWVFHFRNHYDSLFEASFLSIFSEYFPSPRRIPRNYGTWKVFQMERHQLRSDERFCWVKRGHCPLHKHFTHHNFE